MPINKIAEVAVFRPLENKFEYAVPEEMISAVSRGSICEVPLAGGKEKGIILRLKKEKEFSGRLESIASLLFKRPLAEENLKFAEWISGRTLTPIGEVLDGMVPKDPEASESRSSSIKLEKTFSETREAIERLRTKAPKQKDILEYLLSVDGPASKNRIRREIGCSYSPLNALREKGLLGEVSGPERTASPAVVPPYLPKASSLEPSTSGFGFFPVIDGLEGRLSFYGKTLEELGKRESMLLLVPTIYESEEMKVWFENNFDVEARSFHSRMSRGRTARIWREAFRGDLKVLIGMRKALFAPLGNPGAVVVEKEGHGNYRPEGRRPKIDVSRAAEKLAEIHDIPFHPAGGIPSLDTFYRVREDKKLDSKTVNVHESKKKVKIVDKRKTGKNEILTPPLRRKLDECFSRERRAVLIGESRGNYSAVACEECGEVLRCDDCGVPLAYYRKGFLARCNYCGKKLDPESCPSCGGNDWVFLGGGVDRIGSVLTSNWPGLEIREILNTRLSLGDYFEILEELDRGKIDAVVGTRAATSLLIRKKVDLIGVVGLDGSLSRPDYRSSELTLLDFQRMLEVLAERGTLVVQTLKKGHKVFDSLESGGWKNMYRTELASRQQFLYPPYSKLVKIIFRGAGEEKNLLLAEEIADLLKKRGDWRIMGPKQDYPEKSRSILMVKTQSVKELISALKESKSRKSDHEILVEAEY